MTEKLSIDIEDYLAGGGRFHSKLMCKRSRGQGAPKNCVIHKPSLHVLMGSKMILKGSGLILRVCNHGASHPDPDSVAFFAWNSQRFGGVYKVPDHACDGCCTIKANRGSRRPSRLIDICMLPACGCDGLAH